MLLALLLFYPLSTLLEVLFTGSSSDVWEHLKEVLLVEYTINSVILIVYVSILCILLGFMPAFYLSKYQFKGANFLSWALILPLTIPSYIMAFAYAGFFDLTGLISKVCLLMGFEGFHMDVLNRSVLGLVLAFSLFTYLFIISKVYLEGASRRYIEAAETLGLSRFSIFRRVVLPLSRPAIIAGLSLVIMELLNDYGAVKYFGVPTFTTGIFKVWFAFGDHESALKLASILMLIALLVLLMERWSRKKMKFISSKIQNVHFDKRALEGNAKYYVPILCWLPFTLCFLIPLSQLIYWASQSLDYLNDDFFGLFLQSVGMALLSSLIILIIAVWVSFVVRVTKLVWIKKWTHILTLGYAIPGAIIAVCVLIPFTSWSIHINEWFNLRWGLFLNQLFITLIFAYLLRFFAVGYNGIDSSYEKISTSIDESAEILGLSKLKILFRVHLANLKPALLASFLMLFIDILKELPLTLILRPFNFDTLATKTYELAGDEMLEESAWPALIIILVGASISYLLKRVIK